MKRIILMASLALALTSQAQINMPAASTTQRITQAFGMGSIEITYSRPNINNRSLLKENSDLAPLNKMWRTGANAATRIKFTDNVTIGGKRIDTGSYVIYTIPGKEYWDVILNKGLNNWGTDGYKEAEDVVRVKVKAEKLGQATETFAIQIANVAYESCELQLTWGNTLVKLPISTNVKDRLRAQVQQALSAEKVNPGVYWNAANFYYEWDKDMNKALTSINKATEANPNAFYMFLLKAKIQRDLGDKASAKASAEKCIELATTAKNDEYVKLAKELIAKL
jgi:tetratricopeptide (TPR) repeat protein